MALRRADGRASFHARHRRARLGVRLAEEFLHSKEEEHFTNAYGNSCIAFLKDFSYLPLTKRLTALFTKHPIYWDTVRFAKKDKIMKIIQIMQQYDLSKEEIEKQLEDLIKKTQKE